MSIKLDRMFWICCALILFALFTRVLPHPMNFTPIGAIALFAGAYLSYKRTWLIPIAALVVSDAIIGFYDPISMFFVYLGFAASAVLGRYFLQHKRTVLNVAGTTLAGATVFFVLSNFGMWLTGLAYPMTLEGLIQCYVMAIPFFGNTLLGDAMYVILLFGSYELLRAYLKPTSINSKIYKTA